MSANKPTRNQGKKGRKRAEYIKYVLLKSKIRDIQLKEFIFYTFISL